CAHLATSSPRTVALVSRHLGNASAAALTALSTSAAVPRGTRASTSRVAGLITSMVSPLTAGTHSPPIRCAFSMISGLAGELVADSERVVLICCSSVLVDDHAADVLAVVHVLIALVDLLQPVAAGDQLVELEGARAVQAQ